MKRNSLILAALVLAAVALPLQFSWAQNNTQVDPMMLFGVRGNTDGITVTTGAVKRIRGNFYALGYGDVGTGQNSASLEAAYIIKVGKIGVGVLLGPNSDWKKAATERDATNYIVVGTGLLASYFLVDGIQVWGGYKRKIPLEESQHKAMNIFGVGLAFSFKR